MIDKPEIEWAQKGKGWLKPTCGCDPDTNLMCFRHKLKTIQFNGAGKSRKTLREAQLAKDLPAYQRLRNNGLQPIGTKGAAEMEKRATSQVEIEMGHLFDKKVLPRVEEGMALSREMEWTPDPTSVAAAKERRVKGA